MKTWTRLRCRCGAHWSWWGRPAEATGLRRVFEREHAGAGCHVEDVGR